MSDETATMVSIEDVEPNQRIIPEGWHHDYEVIAVEDTDDPETVNTMSGVAAKVDGERLCDHRCLKPDSHVEGGTPHFYGYQVPSTDDLAYRYRRLYDEVSRQLTALYEWADEHGVRLPDPGEGAT